MKMVKFALLAVAVVVLAFVIGGEAIVKVLNVPADFITGDDVTRSGPGGDGESDVNSDVLSEEVSESHYCTPEQRGVESCEYNDHPICGWFDPEQVECSDGPCVRSLFPNECEACSTAYVLYWTEGDCPLHTGI